MISREAWSTGDVKRLSPSQSAFHQAVGSIELFSIEAIGTLQSQCGLVNSVDTN
jgi:hypothetical protein